MSLIWPAYPHARGPTSVGPIACGTLRDSRCKYSSNSRAVEMLAFPGVISQVLPTGVPDRHSAAPARLSDQREPRDLIGRASFAYGQGPPLDENTGTPPANDASRDAHARR